jgi:SOS-response transcriptional repressor LexA
MLVIALASDKRGKKQIAEEAQRLPDGEGLTPSALSAYVKEEGDDGYREPSEKHIRALARVLGLHPSVLTTEISREDIFGAAESLAKSAPPPNDRPLRAPRAELVEGGRLIRLPGWEIHAGSRSETFDEEPTKLWRIDDGLIEDSSLDHFVLVVRGQSMADPEAADIQEGARLLMAKRPPVHMDIVAARVDGEATLARYHKERGRAFLRKEPGPGERAYEDIPWTEHCVCEGVLVLVMTVKKAGKPKK